MFPMPNTPRVICAKTQTTLTVNCMFVCLVKKSILENMDYTFTCFLCVDFGEYVVDWQF